MISVCMATYNGEKYIEKQMRSILSQISGEDEVVIQDDCSSDNTIEIIKSLRDPRIRVEINEKNQGHIKNFEIALTRAKGDIIFLSDQDDEWMLGKVEAVLRAFQDAGTMGVVTDAVVVDAEDKIINESYFQITGSRSGVLKNYIHNSYLGCCLAFRREVLQPALPIPRSVRTHDGWLGIVANMLGDVVFLDEKLLRYKRHGNNASQMHRFGMGDVIKRRLSLAFHMVRVQPTIYAVRQARIRKGENAK